VTRTPHHITKPEKTGGTTLSAKRLAVWTLAIFAAWWVIQNPAQAGHAIRSGGGGVSHAAHSVSTVINNSIGSGGTTSRP
jgi:hypothetical protein